MAYVAVAEGEMCRSSLSAIFFNSSLVQMLAFVQPLLPSRSF